MVPNQNRNKTMTTITATFISTDKNSLDGVNVWFDVVGTNDGDEDGEYGLSVVDGEVMALLDCDGCPCNTDDNHISVVFEACNAGLTDEMINY